MLELFWLLLPVAALSGWVIGRRGATEPAGRGRPLQQEYFQGLNYLLSEQPDKAIEVFTRMVEVDADTAETHLALGSLFRRRGEVDRAIRIHQNLIARPSLDRRLRAYALLQLGEDYMRAGLLDRAESLFEQVVDSGMHVDAALRQLLVVYQQQKDWQEAIATASRMSTRAAREAAAPLVAQFYCELAEEAHARGDLVAVRQHLKQALSRHPGCVRASILLGDLEHQQGHQRAAIRAYQRVREQDPEFLPEVLAPMLECYRELKQPQAMMAYLQEIAPEQRGSAPMLMLAELIRENDGERAAVAYLSEQLQQHPSVRGLERLVAYAEDAVSEPDPHLQTLRELFAELLKARPTYECRQCGFTGKSLYWQCPSCRSWASVKAITGIKGE